MESKILNGKLLVGLIQDTIDRDLIYSNFIPSEVIPGITDFEVYCSKLNIARSVLY